MREGRVCSMVYGERVCHKATETAERDVKDELKECVQKCEKDLPKKGTQVCVYNSMDVIYRCDFKKNQNTCLIPPNDG